MKQCVHRNGWKQETHDYLALYEASAIFPWTAGQDQKTLRAAGNTFLFTFFVSLKKVTALDIIYVTVNDE